MDKWIKGVLSGKRGGGGGGGGGGVGQPRKRSYIAFTKAFMLNYQRLQFPLHFNYERFELANLCARE